MKTGNKKQFVALLLVIFLGGLGIHRMYVGKTGTGIFMLLLTLSFIGIIFSAIWAFIDFIMIVIGTFTDYEGKKLAK